LVVPATCNLSPLALILYAAILVPLHALLYCWRDTCMYVQNCFKLIKDIGPSSWNYTRVSIRYSLVPVAHDDCLVCPPCTLLKGPSRSSFVINLGPLPLPTLRSPQGSTYLYPRTYLRRGIKESRRNNASSYLHPPTITIDCTIPCLAHTNPSHTTLADGNLDASLPPGATFHHINQP
jgi:hypothetical protein